MAEHVATVSLHKVGERHRRFPGVLNGSVPRRRLVTPRRKAALVAAGGLIAGALGGMLGQTLWDAGRAAAAPSAAAGANHQVTAATPAGQGARVNAPDTRQALRDLGVVRGVYELKGPVSAPAGAWTVFAVDGPARFARTDTTAPFAFRFDTRGIPDGRYVVTVRLGMPGRAPMTWTSALAVANAADPASRGRIPGRPRPPASPTGTAQPPATNPTQPPGTAPSSDFLTQVVDLTNQQRAANGCGALKVNATLAQVAQAHSADMAANNYFSHDSQNGQSPFDRMTAAGYHFSAAAENIAAGQRTPSDVVTAWMNSEGHRANILNCTYTEIGVGYATGGSYGTYWTQDFGKPM
jgi:uncharacterized YkwD family protein